MTNFASTDDVAEHFDRVHVVVRLVFCRCIDDGNIVFRIPANVFLEEFLRSQVTIKMIVIVLVAIFEVEFCRRFAETVGTHAINF